ncbi:hypothetical protein Ancab_029570 [Ancistrocladus abbreviatus]
MTKQKSFTFLSSLLVLLLQSFTFLVKGECTCNSEDEKDHGGRDKTIATKYKFIGFGLILIAGALGISLPILGKKIRTSKHGNSLFTIVKSFAGGVILGTGAVHIAPDAFESLTSPCLDENPWGKFPFAGLIVGISIMGTMMIDVLANSYFSKIGHEPVEEEDIEGHADDRGNAGHGHLHGPATSTKDSTWLDLLRHRVIAQVLEVGILVHSVIIGLDMGVSQSPDTIKPLIVAITFHQLFEGLGLGGCISAANFKSRAVVVMVLFFALTTPVGILIGFGATHIYSETSPTALIVEGVLNATAAGILFYMSLVDILGAELMKPQVQSNLKLLLGAGFSMILGFSCMSLLAIWA